MWENSKLAIFSLLLEFQVKLKKKKIEALRETVFAFFLTWGPIIKFKYYPVYFTVYIQYSSQQIRRNISWIRIQTKTHWRCDDMFGLGVFTKPVKYTFCFPILSCAERTVNASLESV